MQALVDRAARRAPVFSDRPADRQHRAARLLGRQAQHPSISAWKARCARGERRAEPDGSTGEQHVLDAGKSAWIWGSPRRSSPPRRAAPEPRGDVGEMRRGRTLRRRRRDSRRPRRPQRPPPRSGETRAIALGDRSPPRGLGHRHEDHGCRSAARRERTRLADLADQRRRHRVGAKAPDRARGPDRLEERARPRRAGRLERSTARSLCGEPRLAEGEDPRERSRVERHHRGRARAHQREPGQRAVPPSSSASETGCTQRGHQREVHRQPALGRRRWDRDRPPHDPRDAHDRLALAEVIEERAIALRASPRELLAPAGLRTPSQPVFPSLTEVVEGVGTVARTSRASASTRGLTAGPRASACR